MKMVKGLIQPCELSETQVCFAESKVLTKYTPSDYSQLWNLGVQLEEGAGKEPLLYVGQT